MTETLAELREQFQKQREYEERLYIKAVGYYSGYYVDNQENYYIKNIKETKNSYRKVY